MKKIISLTVSLTLMLTMVSCFSKNGGDAAANGTASTKQMQDSTNTNISQTIATNQTSSLQTSAVSPDNSQGSAGDRKEELLQSTNADLDADGKDEVIQVFKVVIKKSGTDGANEVEGVLKIKSPTVSREIVFLKKDEGLTGVMSSLDIRDMDGDGAKDVFITIPDVGASFSINYFFMYSFKLDKSYSYYADSNLNDFAASFAFKYEGKGILSITNTVHNFKAKLDITSKNKGITADDENNSIYENSWVEPVPDVINEASKLAIENSSDGKPLIKVPLPIFGQATSDMIGEVDLYYGVDKNFEPYMYKFDVLDYSDTGSVKAGSALIR